MTGLLTFCLAGGPLYVSSVATASVRTQLDRTCVSDSGLRVVLDEDVDARAFLDARIAELPNVARRIDTARSSLVRFTPPGPPDGLERTMTLLHRSDQGADLMTDPAIGGTIDELEPGEIALPEFVVGNFGLVEGSPIVLEAPPASAADEHPESREVRLGASYGPISVRPEPEFWCGLRELFRPNFRGDPPAPVGFVSTPDQALLGRFSESEVEIWIERRGLSRHDARDVAAAFDRLVEDYAELIDTRPEVLRSDGRARSQLPVLIKVAESYAELVRRTIVPVRLAGVLASLGLLTATSVMLAGARRRELRLAQLRGEGPGTTLVGQLGRAVVPCAVGGAVGLVAAIVTVRSFGPASELEPGPVRSAVVWAVGGSAIAAVLVAFVVTVVAGTLVDARARSRRRRRTIPWELGIVAVAALSYARLDRVGGVRLLGSEAKGGDLLALSFPLLAVLTPVAVLARPVAWLIHRFRFALSTLWLPLRLGLRRVTHEAWASTIVAAGVAIAAGTFVIAGALSASAEALLRDKAGVFLGTDLVLSVRTSQPNEELAALPQEIAGRATYVARSRGSLGDRRVDLLGVDAATFADAAVWRDDASADSLQALLDRLRVQTDLTAPTPVVVSPARSADSLLDVSSGTDLRVEQVGAAAFFPGTQTGVPLVVLPIDSLRAALPNVAVSLWIRDPPDGVVETLAATGIRTHSPRTVDDVFDGTSFLAVEWAYDAFAGLGLLVALVTLQAEFVVLQARRQRRQSAFVVTNRMRLSRRGHALAIFVELALPLIAGAAVGMASALVAVHLSAGRLDPLRHLLPAAEPQVDSGSLVLACVAVLATLVVLTTVGAVTTWRARPMEVMRGTA